MLVVENICKTYETRTILKDISFTVNSGERAALFGVNGSGKTTLFRIINGEEKADRGSFHFIPPDLPYAYLQQKRSFPAEATIESVLQLNKKDSSQLSAEIESLSVELSQTPQDQELQNRFEDLLHAIQQNESDTDELKQLLNVFGLSMFELNTPVSILSGGQRTRLALAAALSSNAKLLMLDEPTNDLDEEMLKTLEKKLCSFRGAVLYVSHDRAFLNNTATKIIDLDRNTHQIKIYDGNYEYWCKRKAAEEAAALAAWNRQQSEIERLKASAARVRDDATFRKGGKADTNDKFAKAFFANRSRDTVKRAKHIENRLDSMLDENKLSKPGANWKIKMNTGAIEESGSIILNCSDLSIGYDKTVIREGLNFTIKSGQICALVGPNGSGKSTLIKSVMGELEPIAGRFRINTRAHIGYLPQGVRPDFIKGNALISIQSICGLNETEARRLLSFYLFFGDEVFTPIESLSNGQIVRLTLAGFSATGKNFLILDEPLNHLDIESREEFEQALLNFPGTTLVVAHDRYFVERTADVIWKLS